LHNLNSGNSVIGLVKAVRSWQELPIQ